MTCNVIMVNGYELSGDQQLFSKSTIETLEK